MNKKDLKKLFDRGTSITPEKLAILIDNLGGGSGVEIIDSVDKLDPNAEVGSMASVVTLGNVQEVSISELPQPDASILDETTYILDASNCPLVSGLSVVVPTSAIPVTTTISENEMIYFVPESLNLMGMSGETIVGILPVVQNGELSALLAMYMDAATQTTQNFTLFSITDGVVTTDQNAINQINTLINGLHYIGAMNYVMQSQTLSSEVLAVYDMVVKAVSGVPNKAYVYLKKDNWEELYAKDFEKLQRNIDKVSQSILDYSFTSIENITLKSEAYNNKWSVYLKDNTIINVDASTIIKSGSSMSTINVGLISSPFSTNGTRYGCVIKGPNHEWGISLDVNIGGQNNEELKHLQGNEIVYLQLLNYGTLAFFTLEYHITNPLTWFEMEFDKTGIIGGGAQWASASESWKHYYDLLINGNRPTSSYFPNQFIDNTLEVKALIDNSLKMIQMISYNPRTMVIRGSTKNIKFGFHPRSNNVVSTVIIDEHSPIESLIFGGLYSAVVPVEKLYVNNISNFITADLNQTAALALINTELYSGDTLYDKSSIIIPNGIVTIGAHQFYQTNVISVVFANSVSLIKEKAFYNCTSIQYCDFSTHNSIPTLQSNAFYNIPSTCKIIVPDALYDEWIAATNWSSYADNIINKSDWDASQVTE